jgi:hypothetical protein
MRDVDLWHISVGNPSTGRPIGDDLVRIQVEYGQPFDYDRGRCYIGGCEVAGWRYVESVQAPSGCPAAFILDVSLIDAIALRFTGVPITFL